MTERDMISAICFGRMCSDGCPLYDRINHIHWCTRAHHKDWHDMIVKGYNSLFPAEEINEDEFIDIIKECS